MRSIPFKLPNKYWYSIVVHISYGFAFGSITWILTSCGKPTIDCDPNKELPRRITYTKVCEPHLGVMPTIDCSEGVLIPLTVNGEDVWKPQDNFDCDHHSMQEGQCMPGATVVRKIGKDAAGNPLNHVVWLGFCRPEQLDEFDGPGSLVVDVVPNIDIIGYNSETGATCMLATDVGGIPKDTSEGTPWKAEGILPGSDDPRFDEMVKLERTEECAECHQSTPFIHSPWIDGARMPDNPEEPVVPIVSGPNAPYWLLGTDHRRILTPHIENNGCVSCHRFPSRTEALFRENGWEASEHMPPNDPGSLNEDHQAMLNCLQTGPENTPGCDWISPPAGECEGEIAQ